MSVITNNNDSSFPLASFNIEDALQDHFLLVLHSLDHGCYKACIHYSQAIDCNW